LDDCIADRLLHDWLLLILCVSLEVAALVAFKWLLLLLDDVDDFKLSNLEVINSNVVVDEWLVGTPFDDDVVNVDDLIDVESAAVLVLLELKRLLEKKNDPRPELAVVVVVGLVRLALGVAALDAGGDEVEFLLVVVVELLFGG
jgi:hypothetical protein